MSNQKKVIGDDRFSTSDVCKICRIPRERLRDWINRKYIKPTSFLRKNKQKIAVFDTRKVIHVMVLKLLIDEGLHRKHASQLSKTIDLINPFTEEALYMRTNEVGCVWTIVELENPRKAVFRGITQLKRKGDNHVEPDEDVLAYMTKNQHLLIKACEDENTDFFELDTGAE